jgi:hypothetical protein
MKVYKQHLMIELKVTVAQNELLLAGILKRTGGWKPEKKGTQRNCYLLTNREVFVFLK